MTLFAPQVNPFGEIAGILMSTQAPQAAIPLAAMSPGDSAERDTVARNLLSIARFALDADYRAFKSERELVQRMLSGLFDFGQSPLSNLDVYLGQWRSGAGAARLLQEYPVLQTLKKRCLAQHERYRNAIRRHLAADRDLLTRAFGPFDGDLMLEGIDFDLGDAHQHGKSSAVLTLRHGRKIVYKPRSGGIDLAFKGLVDALNERIPGLALRSFGVVDKGSYSWSEYIAHAPCDSSAAIHRYYQRCGALACIVYLLMGTDFHFENIIACGEYPVLVDLECLFNSTLGDSYDVMSTGLIPRAVRHGDHTAAFDVSGMGACGRQLSGTEVWDWCGDGDALGLVTKPGVFTAEINQPVLEGQHVSPEDYLDDIIEGFALVYHWFAANQAQLDAEDGLLAGFRDKTVRVLARSTQAYRTIRDQSLTPASLVSRNARRQGIVQALQAHETFQHHPDRQSLADETREKLGFREALALERLDTPYLLANTSRHTLTESGKPICAAFFKTTPYEFVVDRIKSLTPENLILQTKLIEQAFASRYAGPLPSSIAAGGSPQAPCVIRREIENIAELILASQEAALAAGISAGAASGQVRGGGQGTSPGNLFCGELGACLFLSAADRSAGSERYAAVVDATLRQAIDSAVLRYAGPGGVLADFSYSTGLAGLIFALMRVDPVKYETAACDLSRLITAEVIHGDRNLDFMAGSAGCLLVLTELYRWTKSAEVLKTAETIGAHLLSSRRMDRHSGHRAWTPWRFNRPQTGFSHGAAGIALALLQLYAANKDAAYLDAFHEATAFENFYFERGMSNWRDLRGAGTQCQTAWCHGAPGIGLSRIHAFRILGDERLLDDVRAALAATRHFRPGTEMIYCCGRAGCLDFLLEAGRLLEDRELLGYVNEEIERMIVGAGAGGLARNSAGGSVESEGLSLFRGAGGIAYVFLRARDERLASMMPCAR